MPTTLTNGIQLPDKGSVDWYSSMQSNYNLIDTHLGDTDTHVTAEDRANWNSKQGSLSQAQLDAIAQVATNTSDIATLQSGKANASHTHSSSDITDIGDYATKQYVDTSISGLVDNAPDALNTLNELSAALNDDSNFASTITTALAAKADSSDLATVATSGSYNDLSNKPTINDSTITIQKNGSTVDTFTTNGSAKTIDIPVPTKTSDLTNDSNFVVSSSLATVATSGFYNDLDNKPYIPDKISDLIDDSNFVDTSNPAVASGITSAKVTDYDTHIADTDIHVTTADKTKWNNGVTQSFVFRYSSTALVASSTNSNTLLDNTDNLKVGDKVIDSNGVLFSITAIDTANSTFSIGTALIDLALDGNVVHTDEINSSGIGIIEAVKEVGGVDFNTLTTQGLYGANASGSTNNPVASPCVVQVIRRLNSVIQIANVSSSAYKSRYIRYCADITAQSPVWQSWIKFATDDEVVHNSGNETIGGSKTFNSHTYIYNSDNTATTPNLYLRSSKIEISSQNNTSGDQNLTYLDKNKVIYANVKGAIQSNGSAVKIRAIAKDSSDNSVINELQMLAYTNGNKAIFPSYSNEIDLGISSYKWKSIYATNYYYGSDNVEFSTKFVTTDTNQIISGDKVWTGANIFKQNITYERTNFYHQTVSPCYFLKDTELEKGSIPQAAHTAYPGLWQDKNSNILGYVRFVEYSSGRQTAEFKVSNLIKNGALDPTGSEVNCAVLLELQPSGEKSLIPEQNNDINLGTATKKWKSFNGLTPSSLSLPSGNASDIIDISSYLSVLDGSNANTYVAPANGWISITMSSCSGIQAYITGLWGHQIVRPTVGGIRFFMPVLKNKTTNILIFGGVIDNARFIPCQGNV